MNPVRRSLFALPLGVACGALLTVGRARAARREVEDLGLSLELPDHWVPIPRAEILEARDRAVAAGASTEWTMRAAWQQPPHLRWFSLPYLTLESRAAPGLAEAAPAVEHVAGQSGGRTIHAHRAVWRTEGLDLRLSLLSFDERRDEFESWLASLRSVRTARP
jgi:muconolactone delta-isomerase